MRRRTGRLVQALAPYLLLLLSSSLIPSASGLPAVDPGSSPSSLSFPPLPFITTADSDRSGNSTDGPASTNPIADGWYAGPDIVRFGDTYWVYVALGVDYPEQLSFDAFSLPADELGRETARWTAHPGVFKSGSGSVWARNSYWAPSVVERGRYYYLYYTANDPDFGWEKRYGIGVAMSRDGPDGPFEDLIQGPFVFKASHHVQPKDPMVFHDDGRAYLVWGGGGILIAPLGGDMGSLGLWDPDGAGDDRQPRDITPEGGYGEAPYMFKHRGRYYLFWSEGDYEGGDYTVPYAMSDSLTGPFKRVEVILQKDGVVADGPGQISIVRGNGGEGEDDFWIAYQRRVIGDYNPDHRVIAIDRLWFYDDGTIVPVVMT